MASKTPNLFTPYTRADGVECILHPPGDCLLSGERRTSNLTLMEAYRAGIIADDIVVKSGIPQGRRATDNWVPSISENYGSYAERSDYIFRKKYGWRKRA